MSPAALAAVPGDPDTVLALATRLRGQAARVGSLARLLRSLTTAGRAEWEGPAAAAFTRRAEAAVAPLLRIETRYAVAAATLVPLAEALRECQAAVATAVAERNDALPRFLALGDAMAVAEQSPEASGRAQAVRLREAMVMQGSRVELAEAAHAAAHDRWRAADLRAARLLGRLVQDGAADDRLYDALTATSRAGGDRRAAHVGRRGPAGLRRRRLGHDPAPRRRRGSRAGGDGAQGLGSSRAGGGGGGHLGGQGR